MNSHLLLNSPIYSSGRKEYSNGARSYTVSPSSKVIHSLSSWWVLPNGAAENGNTTWWHSSFPEVGMPLGIKWRYRVEVKLQVWLCRGRTQANLFLTLWLPPGLCTRPRLLCEDCVNLHYWPFKPSECPSLSALFGHFPFLSVGQTSWNAVFQTIPFPRI